MTDTAAFAALYRQHAPTLRLYLLRRTSDAELAADLTQEVFCKFLAAVRNGVEVWHVSGYLHRIAHNLLIDFYKRRDILRIGSLDSMLKRNQTRIGDAERGPGNANVELGDYLPDPFDLEAEAVDRLTLTDALRAATPQQSTVFALRCEGYSFREIGTALDLSERAAKQTQVRCMANLRERMGA